MIAIGLTGNLGSGKSTVARLLRERGAAVLDADLVVREMLAEGGEAVPDVIAAFPSAATPDGRAVQRTRLAELVFGDEDARHRLEDILHPRVHARQAAWLDAQRREGASLAVVEASQMLEAHARGGPDPRERFDLIVVVTCDDDERLRRAVSRAVAAGVPADRAERDARSRIAAQMPQERKAALADLVVDNSGSLADAEAAVDRLHADLARRAAGGAS